MPEYDTSAFRGAQVGAGISDILTGLAQNQVRKRRQKREDFLARLEEMRLQREQRQEEAAAKKEAATEKLAGIGRLFGALRNIGAPEEELRAGFRPAYESAYAEAEPIRGTSALFAEPDVESEVKQTEAQNKKQLAKLKNDVFTLVTYGGGEKGELTPSAKHRLGEILTEMEKYDFNEANRYRNQYLPSAKTRRGEAQDRIEKRRGELEALNYTPQEIEEAIKGQFGIKEPETSTELTGADLLRAKQQMAADYNKAHKEEIDANELPLQTPEGISDEKAQNYAVQTKTPLGIFVPKPGLKPDTTKYGPAKPANLKRRVNQPNLRAQWQNKNIDDFTGYQEGYNWLQTVRSALSQDEYSASVAALKQKFPRAK